MRKYEVKVIVRSDDERISMFREVEASSSAEAMELAVNHFKLIGWNVINAYVVSKRVKNK